MNKDWIKVENFISEDLSTLLYGYILLAHKRLSVTRDNRHGTFSDPQSMGDFSMYGDLIFDTLLMGKLDQLQEITGEQLVPQYSYYRLYKKGSELKRHIDRESCEISLTLCIGYDSHYAWPIWFKDRDGNEISIETERGDMVIYKGCELEHWREPFEGNYHAQVFLHYNRKNGRYNNKFDGREVLGVPA
jgi:hypothetical protein